MKRNLALYIITLVLFSFTGNMVNAQTLAVGDLQTVASGQWTSTNLTIWQKWTGSAWTSASSVPTQNRNVYIRSGTTITVPTSLQANCKSLIVDPGGKLYTNITDFATSNVPIYVSVYGNIYCNGTIGNGTTQDVISFNMEGSNDTISGTGNFDAARMRKTFTTNATTTVVMNRNVNLRYETGATNGGASGTAFYNNCPGATLNLIINAGDTLNVPGAYDYSNGTVFYPGNEAICGVDGSGSPERGGTYTVNGVFIVANTFDATDDNSDSLCAIVLNNGGKMYVGSFYCAASASGSHSITINNGGYLKLTSGGFSSFSTSNNHYNFNAGSTVEYGSNGSQLIETGINYSNLILSDSGNKHFTGTTLNIGENLTITGDVAFTPSNSGTINIGGNWTTYSNTAFQALSTTVNATGSGTQTFKSIGAYPHNYEGYFDLNVVNSDDTLQLGSKIQISDNLYVGIGATLNADSFIVAPKLNTSPSCEFDESSTLITENIYGVDTTLTLTPYPGFDGYNNFVFNGLALQSVGATEMPQYINNLYINNTYGVTIPYQLLLSGTLYLQNGPLYLLGNDITLFNSVTNAITTTNGYIVSEYYLTQGNSPTVYVLNPYLGFVRWFVDNTNGIFKIPFGTNSGQSIPFAFQNSNNRHLDTVGVATWNAPYGNYNTGTLGPYPQTVTNLIHWSSDNSDNCAKRFWQLDKTGTDTVTAMTFTCANSEARNNANTSSLVGLVPQRWNGSIWESPLTPGSAIITIPGGATGSTVTNIPNFSPWVLVENSVPLPIELLTFNAVYVSENNLVHLTWETASEINNNFFTVERTIDGENFEIIGKVKGAGNSNSARYYSLNDSSPVSGISYYRLKQTDFDGKYKYSNLAPIYINTNAANPVAIFPNPSNENTILSFVGADNSNTTIEISDLEGRIIFEENIECQKGGNLININSSAFINGIYLVRITNSNWTKVAKLCVQH